LKNLSIRCLAQTRQGFLWVGTENGLFRFNGQNFTMFGTAQGLPSNSIQAIKESEDGTLWVGSRMCGTSMMGRGSAVSES